MADTTATRSYPYPEHSDDFLPDTDIQALADAVDADVDAIEARVTATEDKPLTILVQQIAQSMAYATAAAITYTTGAETIDSHDFHDAGTSTSKITPSVPGWYEFTATFFMSAPGAATRYARLDTYIAKNGTEIPSRARESGIALDNSSSSVQTVAYEQANGTTDFFQHFGEQANSGGSGSKNTNVSGGFVSTFCCKFVRKL